mgnify:CR=1 FL=1
MSSTLKSTPAQLRAYKNYREKNREQARRLASAWYAANKEEIKAKRKIRYNLKKLKRATGLQAADVAKQKFQH